jgi:hypothetical protein
MGGAMDFLRDLLGYLKEHKKYSFLPIILILFLAALFITIAANPAVAPFIYALF